MEHILIRRWEDLIFTKAPQFIISLNNQKIQLSAPTKAFKFLKKSIQ
jgi:hypothetical protein